LSERQYGSKGNLMNNKQQGIYAVDFRTPRSFGSGVIIVFENGRVYGGDHVCFYRGTISADESGNITGELRIKQHSAGQSVFGPVSDFTLALSGSSSNGHASLAGNTAAAPGMLVNVECRRVDDL
jgi:hypothetical protein